MTHNVTRRSFLAAVSATGVTLGSAVASGQGVAKTFTLAMTEDGWVGQSPSAIEGKSAPALNLKSGKKYRIKWVNRTTEPHNLTITKGYPGGVPILQSPFIRKKGNSDTVTFTAQEGLAAYYCQNHIGEKGNILIDGQQATTFEPETVTPDVTEPQPEKVFNLVGTTEGWLDQDTGKINPTLEMVAGKPYAVMWINGDGAPHNFVIEDATDNFILRSDYVYKSGGRQTLKFVATDEMDEYFCEVHPLKMRGEVKLVGEAAEQTTTPTNQTTTMNQTTTTPTNQTTAANQTGPADVDAGDLVQQVRAPGFGALSALAGVGGAGYLLSQRGKDDE